MLFPKKGSGPGVATVSLALVSLGIALYLFFFGFETYYDPDDFPDAVIEEEYLPLEGGP